MAWPTSDQPMPFAVAAAKDDSSHPKDAVCDIPITPVATGLRSSQISQSTRQVSTFKTQILLGAA